MWAWTSRRKWSPSWAATSPQRTDLSHVELHHGPAHALSFLDEDQVDVVILNSTVQYFPDTDYLLEVLAEAVRVTEPGGHIFVGDVRSLPLLAAYHTSVEVHRAPGELPLPDLRARISQAQRTERELVLDPALFEEIGQRWAQVGRVERALKAGRYDNELSRFRYDVTIQVGEKAAVAVPERWVSWDAAGQWQAEVTGLLAQEPELAVGVRGIRDERIAGAVETVRQLQASDREGQTVEELCTAVGKVSGTDPNAIMELAQRLGVGLSWQGFEPDGIYDGIFNPRWESRAVAATWPRQGYQRYGNAPARGLEDVEFGRELQAYLKQTLPAYMVPAAILVVAAWPLTPNGKVDRRALPIPGRAERQGAVYVEPQSETAKVLAGLWEAVLGVERVGEADDFFALGGHSLLATQLNARIRDTFQLELPLAVIFEQPTVAGIARALQQAEPQPGQVETIAQLRIQLDQMSPEALKAWLLEKKQMTDMDT